MDQPPISPYPAPYPPPKSGVPPWVWILLAVGCGGILMIVLILAAIMFPVFSQARDSARSVSCLSNEKQMALGCLMYAQDYDEVLPASANWMDTISLYIKNEHVFHCPSVQAGPEAFGYAFNSKMSRAQMAKLTAPGFTELLYDSTTLSRSAADAVTSLPVPPRHKRGNNVAFADGHAKNTGTSSTIE